MGEERPAVTLYGVIVGALYVVAVGAQVYVIVDQLTDGGLTSQVTAWWRTASARWAERRRLDREVSESLPWVQFAVHEALREEQTP